jgi:hypothetical protein
VVSVCLRSGEEHESAVEMICAMLGEQVCVSILDLWRIGGVAVICLDEGEVAVEQSLLMVIGVCMRRKVSGG